MLPLLNGHAEWLDIAAFFIFALLLVRRVYVPLVVVWFALPVVVAVLWLARTLSESKLDIAAIVYAAAVLVVLPYGIGLCLGLRKLCLSLSFTRAALAAGDPERLSAHQSSESSG